MQTDYPCRIPRLKGKPFPLSFSFPKGSSCPAGEEEYARSNARCWQNATTRLFCKMPKNDKSSRILLLSCLISGSGAGVLPSLNSRCPATTLIANRMIHGVQVFLNHPNHSSWASICRSLNLSVRKTPSAGKPSHVSSTQLMLCGPKNLRTEKSIAMSPVTLLGFNLSVVKSFGQKNSAAKPHHVFSMQIGVH